MKFATKVPPLISGIRELVEINVDSHNGLSQAASHSANSAVSAVLSAIAKERMKHAERLQRILTPDDDIAGSIYDPRGRIHRTIMDWRDVFSDGPVALLREASRGEDYMKAKYESVLARAAGNEPAGELNRQYATVVVARERINALREALS